MYTYKAAYQANMQYVFCKYTYKSRTKQHIYLFFCRAKVYKMKQNINLITSILERAPPRNSLSSDVGGNCRIIDYVWERTEPYYLLVK